MRKNIFVLLAALCFALSSFGQKTGSSLEQIAMPVSGTTDWVRFKADFKTLHNDLFSLHAEAFGLGINDIMLLQKSEADKLGMTHHRYKQTYKGVPVWGADYTIHEKEGKALSGNGKIVNGLNLSIQPQLNPQQAIEAALSYTNAEKYMWEDAANENKLKYIKNNINASYYPNAELIIAAKHLTRNPADYKLAYKVNIFAEYPMSHKDIFIDALTGEFLFNVNRIHNTDVPGVAVTKYSGTQNFVTDSVQSGTYRLRSNTIGGGVETYDMNRGTNYGSAVDFTDTDNYWNNFNANQDEAATDAHFASQMTYKYFYETFGRLSYDNNDAKLISYIHYDDNYANAFWNGFYMTYGDGDGTSYSALTSIDVCAHEITHAVTEYSANLIYQDEMGALNEGFSDIFGAAVEFYATPANADWFIGEDFDLQGNGFRSMSDPKAAQLPDTYHGQYWVFNDVFDNGGVHTNCGVMAHWFYILTDGKTGTNDNGHNYNVTGIGLDSAAQIAYRMLTAYLVPASVYIDARQASIWAAEDLYGSCSDAVLAVSAAWHAVGIGFPISDYDLWLSRISHPVTACGLSAAEIISGSIIYNGCSASFNAGDTIPIAYSINNGATVNDTIILTSPLDGGDTLNFSFNVPADFSAVGMHEVDVWVAFLGDNEQGNDTLFSYQFENKLQQNTDMRVSAVHSPVSACHLNNEQVVVSVQFLGCDSIEAGASITIGYSVNNDIPVEEITTIPYTMFPRDTFAYQFNSNYQFNTYGTFQIKAWTAFAPDTLNANDTLMTYTIKSPKTLSADTIGFEEPNLNQLILVQTTPYSNAFASYAARNTGTRGMLMTGGNVIDYINYLEMPTGSNTWSINDFLSAKINFCVDATNWTTCHMRFDLKQTHGGILYSQYIGQGDYTVASSMRILVNGVQLGNTYNPATPAADPYLTRFIDLDAYAGTKFTLTFETRNIAKDTAIMGMPFKLDNAYIDNVCFSENSQQATPIYNSLIAVDVFPNPFSSKFTVKYEADCRGNAGLMLTDILGQEVYSTRIHFDSGSNRYIIDTEHLAPGVYVLHITEAGGTLSRKLIKN